jgi:hypothetical protein
MFRCNIVIKNLNKKYFILFLLKLNFLEVFLINDIAAFKVRSFN